MQDIIAKVNELYKTNINTYVKVSSGVLSENYILHSGYNKLFLKKYRFKDETKIKETHNAKKYFSEKDIPVIMPIKYNLAYTYFEYNKSFYALFPFVEDIELTKDTLTQESVISMGNMLGKIHKAGRDAKIITRDNFKLGNKEVSITEINNIINIILSIEKPSEFDKISLEALRLRLKLSDKYKDSIHVECDHLIHGDYLIHNVFFDNNNQVKWVFDFEKASYAPRSYELFRSMFYSIMSHNFTEKDLQYMKLYLDSYSNIYPISKEEIVYGLNLFTIKTIYSFWVISEHYINKNTRADHFILDDYNRVKHISENFNLLVDTFIKDKIDKTS